MSKKERNLLKAYPEIGAGGYARVNGTVEFYSRINALLKTEMTVLDLGAGRGGQLARTDIPYVTELQKLRGKVRKLIGIDVDEAVLHNPFLDESHFIDPEAPLPFGDGAFDLIYSDWVLEHVSTPEEFAAEVHRVLKPAGWFCARTPNRWGITGIGANLIPNRFHAAVLSRLQPGWQERDVFPTTYRLNSRRRLRKYFRPAKWDDFSYFHNSTPPYVDRSRIMMGMVNTYFRIAPEPLATNMHVFLRKK